MHTTFRLLAITKTVLAVFVVSLTQANAQVNDWENPAVFERNQEETHVPYVPYTTVAEALKDDRDSSPYYRSLNGAWKFNWSSSLTEAPDGFYREDYDISGWDDIPVPSCWQMEGYGHPMFRNISHTFVSDPPNVPEDYNPVGSYRRVFMMPGQWEDRQVFLHFEGVKSASYVWINGQMAGYNQGGMEPAEYNITRLVRHGENTIAVKVLRFSDGTYLEDQDMWRLSGIFRDVWLFSTPEVHIRDFFVWTDLDEQYVDATLHVSVELQNHEPGTGNGYSIEAALFDDSGRKVFERPVAVKNISVNSDRITTVTLEETVKNPNKWSAEYPHLYTLTLTLYEPDGNIAEVVSNRIGFREVEIRDQAVLVNGVPIKFNGVNSHVHHPVTGRTMDRETIIKDLTIMKQFNINCVRTSHYPPDVEYLDLADEYGMYIVDETGDEAHANIYLSEDPAWREAYLDRERRMVRRDRNHPSIIIWSAGNESGSGDNIAAIIEDGKKLDPSRPAWLYGGNTDLLPFEDIVGPRYMHPDELETVGSVSAGKDPRPSYMDEYLAATGNGLGQLEEYWDMIYRYPRLTGGAIWDWVSPGIRCKVITTPDVSGNGNDGAIMGRAQLVEGKFGKAVALSGHDEWIELYRDQSLDITGKELTVSAWVYPRGFHTCNPFITKGNHQFALQQTDEHTLEFYIYDTRRISLIVPVPENWNFNWHHIAGVYDGSELKLYLDGQVIGREEYIGTIRFSQYPVNIGKNAELHGQEHTGQLSNALIDNVRIYSRAISDSEMRDDMNAPSGQSADDAVLCLDFERIEEQGEFFSLGIGGRSYGLIWPDRSIQPELWQLKKSPQPVKIEPVDLENGTIRVINRHNFKNLNELDTTWKLLGDDMALQSGSLKLDLPAGSSDTVIIPIDKPELIPGTEYRLLVSFSLSDDTVWAPRGHEVAWEEFDLPFLASSEDELRREELPDVSFEETMRTVQITGKDFTGTFDKQTGTISSFRYLGVEMFTKGPLLNVWRAPTANELERQWGSPIISNQWYDAGIDRLKHTVKTVKVEKIIKGVQITVEAGADAPESTTRFETTYHYTFLGSGDVLLEHHVVARGDMPEWLPKIGIEMTLPDDFNTFTWYGRGPFETYPDRKTGAKTGIYSETVEEQYEPYLIPQDYGNKTDVRWASLSCGDGIGLFVDGTALINVSARHFSTDNLTRANYPFQLTQQDGVTFNIDHRVTGVGGTPIKTLRKYRVLPGEYRYTIRLRPYSLKEISPQELGRQRLSEVMQ